MISFGVTSLILLCFGTLCFEAQGACVSSPKAIKYGDKCVWTTDGGNLTSAKQSCNEDGGAVFTFNATSEAFEILDLLNITHTTPIFIGAIRIKENDSLDIDWLSRPGTWSNDLAVDMAAEEEAGYHDDTVCIQLLQRNLSLTNCSKILSVTICENKTIGSFSKEAWVMSEITEENEFEKENEDFSSRRATGMAVPSAATGNDDPANDNSTCLTETCLQSENQSNSSLSADDTQHDDISSFGPNTEPASTKGADLEGGELMILPSENGFRITNFSTLLSEIVEKSNMSKTPDPTPKPPSPIVISGPNMTRNSTSNKHSNLTNGTLVKEVQFQVAHKDLIFNGGVQVSGLHGGSVQPYTPLLLDQHIHDHNTELLVNTSRILKTLKQEKHVDQNTLTDFDIPRAGFGVVTVVLNYQWQPTFISQVLGLSSQSQPKISMIQQTRPQVFANTVQATADDQHICEEPDELKKDLFSDIMSVGETLVAKIPASASEITVTTDKIVLHSKVMKPDSVDAKMHLEVDHPVTDTHIQLSRYIFDTDDGANVRVSTIAYKKMDAFMKASNKHISSPVVSLTVQYIKGGTINKEKPRIEMDSAIRFEMRTKIEERKQEDKRVCTFWDFTNRQWSSAGCFVISTNISHTRCECNHLTNFAILVMYIETENISLQNQQALFTLTTVGCSLSIACLAMALICYIYLKMLSREKIMIHANLSVSLLLGQIVFVASSDAHRNHIACKTVAILLHYLFMASFTWMMVEGIALYLCCTKGIFHHRDMRAKYFLFGWGLPLVIVVISLAARFPDYGNGPQYSCWLSINHGLIWAFLGPMLFIVVLNVGVMGLVIKCFLTLQANSEKTEAARLRGSLRAMMTLLPLLGVTWILSLLVPFSVVFHYFFVIFNTLQGMCIFFLHCICNEEIRKKFYEKRRRWSTTRTGSDAEMNFPTRRKTGSFDAIRAAAVTTPVTAEYASRTAWT